MDELQQQTAAGQSECLHSELSYKWLEQGRFAWPPIADGAMCLSATQLALLLDGLSWSQAVAPIVKRPVLAA